MHSSDWLAVADRVGAPLAARAAEFEAARALPADAAEALAAAGLYRLLVPRALGGEEVHGAVFFETIERLARHEAASAWCSFIASTAGVLLAYMPAEAAAALFTRPSVQLAGVFAPRGRAVPEGDGWRVSGRWAWGSGSANADFISGGCLVIGEGGQPETLPDGTPRVLSAWFEHGQVQRLDNWDAFGLCGTGSGEFEVAGVFVPRARTASLFAPPVQRGPLYRFPVFGLLALGIAAVTSGLLRHAIDALAELAADKVPQGATRALAQRPATQEALARAEAAWRSARAFVLEAVHAAWQAAEAQEQMPVAARRDLRLACTHAVDSAAEHTTRLYGVAGGSAVFAASPLQRCLRDVQVARQHLMVAGPTWELTGRLLLGLPVPLATL